MEGVTATYPELCICALRLPSIYWLPQHNIRNLPLFPPLDAPSCSPVPPAFPRHTHASLQRSTEPWDTTSTALALPTNAHVWSPRPGACGACLFVCLNTCREGTKRMGPGSFSGSQCQEERQQAQSEAPEVLSKHEAALLDMVLGTLPELSPLVCSYHYLWCCVQRDKPKGEVAVPV